MASRIDDLHGNLRKGETGRQEEPDEDEASFGAVYDRHTGILLRLLKRWLRSCDRPPESARDLHQDVFLIYARLFQGKKPPESPGAMLVTIAWKELRNHVTKCRPVADGGASAEEMPASVRDPEQWATVFESADIVDDVLSRMSPAAAEVMRLVDIEGNTCAEVAEVQGRDAATVASHLSRARKRFCELVRERYEEDPGGGR